MMLSNLIEMLEEKLEQEGNMPVYSSSDYGDMCHTEQLNNIIEVESCIPVKSAYSATGLAFPDYNDPEDVADADCTEMVLVLRYTMG